MGRIADEVARLQGDIRRWSRRWKSFVDVARLEVNQSSRARVREVGVG